MKPTGPDDTCDPTVDLPHGGGRSPRPSLDRGALIDRYIVVDQLGRGGMGVVYKAFDPELGRPVALKLLHTDGGAAAHFRDRLLREAQALARLSHPNVIAVHDVGTFGDDVFLAMEFVEGPSLRQWLEGATHRPREILDVFLAAGEGLAAAHGASLVHRDFKPDNVIVGDDGRVRVLDFGLARVTDEAATTAPAPPDAPVLAALDSGEHHSALLTPLTQAGTIMGTPRFMAPEQHSGDIADERADQFSFCVSLYWALYGQFPFTGRTLEEFTENVLAGRVVDPPSSARVPRFLHQVLLRGLQVKPAARFPSMTALLSALRADPRVKRGRWLRAAGVLALLAAMAAVPLFTRRQQARSCVGGEAKLAGVWDEARRDAMHRAFAATSVPYAEAAFVGTGRLLDHYAEAWTRMHVDSCQATRVRGEQSEELLDLRTHCLNKRLDELRAVTDLLVNADAKLVQRSVKAASGMGAIDECADVVALRAPVRLPPDPAARAAVERLGPEVARVTALEKAGQYAEAARRADALLGPVRELHYRPIEAELFQTLSKVQSHSNVPQAIESAFHSALAFMAGHDDVGAARTWAYLVFLNGTEGRFAEAHRVARIAEMALERANHPRRAEATYLLDLGDMLDDEGRSAEAIPVLQRSIAIREEKLDDAERPGLAMALNDLGVVLLHEERYAESLAVEERALALWEASLGKLHPNVAMTLINIGEALVKLHRLPEAEDYLQRGLAMERQFFGEDSIDVGTALLGIATLRNEQKRFADAIAVSERGLAIMARASGNKGSDRAELFAAIGRAQLELGRRSDAVATYRRALAELDGDSYTARARFNLARALWESGDRGEALGLARQARAAAAATAGARGARDLRDVDGWLAAKSTSLPRSSPVLQRFPRRHERIRNPLRPD